MKTFKGTKGEWNCEKISAVDTLDLAIQNENDELIGWVYSDGLTIDKKEEYETNAKLIAAAPDLLEALQNIVSDLNKGETPFATTILLAEKAISKALD